MTAFNTSKNAAKSRYNIIVVGGGSAGLVSAYIAATLKAKVALIEEKSMGGDCLNTGCVPSKALIKTAKLVHAIRHHDKYGLKSASCEVDLNLVMSRVQSVIDKITPHDSIERYQKLGVECFTGRAEIINAHEIRIGAQHLSTRNLILALGAEPLIPNIPGLAELDTPYRTSANIWQMQRLPPRLVVLGGGPIGCEMAQAFGRLGSHVTLIEKGPRILPREDADVAQMITRRLESEGIVIRTNSVATAIHHKNAVAIIPATGGQPTSAGSGQVQPSALQELIPFDELLVAVGRRPRTQNIDWQLLNASLNPNGTIKVDPFLRIDSATTYACGDVIGPYQLTHAASHQAWYCAVNALFSPLKKFAVDYRVIPWVTFTDPEVARVGLSEDEAKSQGIPYEVSYYGMDDLDRAIADSENYGMIKVLTPPKKDKIIGATIVAPQGGEMLAEMTFAMKHGLGLNKILGTIHPYPTWGEGNKYAAGVWKRQHAPLWALNLLAHYHRWRRS